MANGKKFISYLVSNVIGGEFLLTEFFGRNFFGGYSRVTPSAVTEVFPKFVQKVDHRAILYIKKSCRVIVQDFVPYRNGCRAQQKLRSRFCQNHFGPNKFSLNSLISQVR